MTQQIVNIGTNPNDGTGDNLRTGMTKVNSNFTDVYSQLSFTQAGTGAVARSVQSKLQDTVSASDFGVSTSNTNNSTQLANAIATGKTINVQDGLYPMTNFSQSLTLPLKISGSSHSGVKLQQNSSTTNSILSNTGVSGLDIRNLFLSTPNATTSTTGHPISLIDVNDVLIRDVTINNLSGSGSAIIVYPNLNSTVNNIRIEDLNVFGNLANATNNNGPLIVNGVYSMMRGIYANQVNEFSVEYKNATVHSLISDVIVSNSNTCVTYGNTSNPGPQYCVASNLISYNNAIGFQWGQGGYSATSNMVVHIDTKFETGVADGARFELGSNNNSASNFLFAGTFNNPVHHMGNQNYISGSFYNTGIGVTLESGAATNVTAVQHPGARTSIYNSFIEDVSGQTLSGASSNPIYCHATGEYMGSLSGRWRWVNAVSGFSGSLPSEQKIVVESTGTTTLGIVNDGTGQSGIEVTSNTGTRSFLYTWASDYWQVATSGAFYRFSGAGIFPNTDNSWSLGLSGNRWSNIYATTGTFTGPVTITDPSSSNQPTLLVSATSDTNGASIKLLGNGGTTPSKIIKVASGSLRITNDAASTNLFTLADNGQLALPGNIASTTTGTGTLIVTGGVGITGAVFVGSNIDISTAGSGLRVAEGSNAKQGVATLSSGTVVVSNTSVTATSRIFLTAQDNNSTGALRISARTAGTSFTITSSNGSDSGVVAYEIFEQG